MKQTYRPGVYSHYDVISRRKSFRQRYAFFCGTAKAKAQQTVKSGEVLELNSLEQLDRLFEETGEGKTFYQICRILLFAGVESIFAVPLTADGSKADNDLYESAFQKLYEVKHGGVMLCDSMDEAVLQKLKECADKSSQNERERMAVGAVRREEAVNAANNINSERMALCAQESGYDLWTERSTLYSAAVLAAMIATAEPEKSFNGAECEGLTSVEELPEETVEEFLKNGITVLEKNQGQIQCIRGVTTKTMTSGEPDRTFSSINTMLMIDDIIRSVRERLNQLVRGGGTGFSEDSIASQAAVVLDEKLQQGYLTAFEPPVVYRQEDDPAVCVVELEFSLAAVLSQIYLTAHILI